jgi:hypothetical protein
MEAAFLAAKLMGKIAPGTKPNAVTSTLFANVGKNVQHSGHRSPYPQGVMDYGVPRLASEGSTSVIANIRYFIPYLRGVEATNRVFRCVQLGIHCHFLLAVAREGLRRERSRHGSRLFRPTTLVWNHARSEGVVHLSNKWGFELLAPGLDDPHDPRMNGLVHDVPARISCQFRS